MNWFGLSYNCKSITSLEPDLASLKIASSFGLSDNCKDITKLKPDLEQTATK
jgi:hypothetical protein